MCMVLLRSCPAPRLSILSPCSIIQGLLATALTGFTALLAACPLWKKVKTSGSVPHLSRWFDLHAALPACVSAVADLCPTQKRVATAAADLAAGKGGGGVSVGPVDRADTLDTALCAISLAVCVHVHALLWRVSLCR